MGEDVFLNGMASDSDYDIQIDMRNVGNLLFDWFTPPIETVFFSLPESVKWIPTTNTQTPTNPSTTNSQEQPKSGSKHNERITIFVCNNINKPTKIWDNSNN